MRSSIWRCSSSIFCRSRAARRRSCISRMACACSSLKLEAFHQALLGRLGIRGLADGLDDLIQVRQGDQQAFQDVRPGTRLVQLELAAAGDHLPAVFDKDLQSALDRQQARLAIHQRQQLHAKGGLQRGVFVQLVEHLVRLRAALQLDDDAHPAPVGFIAQVGDIVQPPFARQLGDALDQAGLVELVGDLGDDDAVAAALISSMCASPRSTIRPRPVL